MCCLSAECTESRGRSPPAQAGQAGGMYMVGCVAHQCMSSSSSRSSPASAAADWSPCSRTTMPAIRGSSQCHQLNRQGMLGLQAGHCKSALGACLCWAEGAHLSLAQPGVLPPRLLLCTRVRPVQSKGMSGSRSAPCKHPPLFKPSSRGNCAQQNQLCPPDRHSR